MTKGVTGLCAGCAHDAIIDDGTDEFYESADENGNPTLYHVEECVEHETLLDTVIQWDDTAPEFPAMRSSAEGGCRLCGFVRMALLRRNIDRHESVIVAARYVIGNRRFLFPTARHHGLLYLWCHVFAKSGSYDSIAHVVFQTEVEDADLRQWLRADGRRKSTPLAPENVKWMKSVLAEWDSEERTSDGDQNMQQQFLPSRLIYIGQDNMVDPLRIVLGSNLKEQLPRYAALSYCWGGKDDADKQLKTTLATLSKHLKAIPWKALTPVLRDAIIVCRALNIQYIWIDAVCIIQDDVNDWSWESESMGYIYYHAYLTICPLISGTCLQGFLEPRPAGCDIPFQSRRRPEISGMISLFERNNDEDYLPLWQRSQKVSELYVMSSSDMDRELSKWVRRGWTFQEEYLSNRSLYFGRSMVHMQNVYVCKSETGDFDIGSGIQGTVREIMYFATDVSNPVSTANRAQETAKFEEAYSMDSREGESMLTWITSMDLHNREFTREEDILPAISGLAKAYNQIHHDIYLAGLWCRCLHHQLLWYICNPPHGTIKTTVEKLRRKRGAYIGPSWSWARICPAHSYQHIVSPAYMVPGTISYSNQKVGLGKLATIHFRKEFILVDRRLDLDGPNSYGRIRHASLLVRGKAMEIPTEVTIHPPESGHQSFGYLADRLGTIIFDWQVHVRTPQPSGSMRLFLTASCCQATCNDGKKFLANPEEDHPDGLKDEKAHHNSVSAGNYYAKQVHPCLSCADEGQPEHAFGLVIHPADKPNTYYRVGVFELFGYSGGIRLFQKAEDKEIELV